jgi:hypothetical protein
VAALARASQVTVVAGDHRLEIPQEVLESLHDVYRVSLCGYGPTAPPN